MDENSLLQAEELDVLTSIYPTTLHWDTIDAGITVAATVGIEWGKDREVWVTGGGIDHRSGVPTAEASSSGSEGPTSTDGLDRVAEGAGAALEEAPHHESLSLRYLPPLTLSIFLPSPYPTDAPPVITIIEPTGWLNEEWTRVLQEHLDSQWTSNPGGQCLYTILESCEADSILSILALSFPLLLSPLSLAPILDAYDTSEKRRMFGEENFACVLCLNPKKGRDCVRIRSCRCVFCSPCLKSYFTLLITEGLVESVLCPSLPCVQSRKALPAAPTIEGSETIAGGGDEKGIGREELDEIVGVAMGLRWETLREKNRLESDPSISFCPQVRCRVAVPALKDDEKLRICPSCGHTFCVLCLKTWHGPSNACTASLSSTLVTLFLASTPSKQRVLEQRYGKRNLEKLVRVVEEDRVNKEWMEGKTTPCPSCSVRVEKIEGCAHMQCARCSTHFCYRCGTRLPPLEPYIHYSTPGPCYNKLFDFLPGQEPLPAEWIEDGFAGLGL